MAVFQLIQEFKTLHDNYFWRAIVNLSSLHLLLNYVVSFSLSHQLKYLYHYNIFELNPFPSTSEASITEIKTSLSIF